MQNSSHASSIVASSDGGSCGSLGGSGGAGFGAAFGFFAGTGPASARSFGPSRSRIAAFAVQEVSPKPLRDLAEENELFGHLFAKRSERAASVAFGRMLRRHADTPVAEWFIRYRNNANHPLYRLEEIR